MEILSLIVAYHQINHENHPKPNPQLDHDTPRMLVICSLGGALLSTKARQWPVPKKNPMAPTRLLTFGNSALAAGTRQINYLRLN